MNRKQRRNFKKKFKPEEIELAKLLYLRSICKGRFKEGDKVYLNMEEIKNPANWDIKTKEYHEWCEAHEQDEFTVVYDVNHTDKPEVVCLAEDTTNPKWLFSVVDLKPAHGDDSFAADIKWVRDSYKKKEEK